MSVINPGRRFWRSIETTHPPELDIVPRPRSLDALLDQIRRKQGHLVHCQCETAKAEIAVEDAKAALFDALVEVDKEINVLHGRQIEGPPNG